LYYKSVKFSFWCSLYIPKGRAVHHIRFRFRSVTLLNAYYEDVTYIIRASAGLCHCSEFSWHGKHGNKVYM